MAGDWIKVEEATPDKPEIAILARKLGVSIGDAFLEWFKLYRWLGRVTGPGLVPNLSLADADMLSGARPGTATALAAAEIGWLRCDSQGIHVEKWDRHNSKAAKARALEQEKKRNQRAKTGEVSPPCPQESGTTAGPEERRGEENPSSLDEWKTNGSAAHNGHSSLSSRSSGSVRGDREEPIDLTDLDWSHVEAMAEATAKRIPPRTTEDRRAWLRFVVLAELTFGELWLVETAEQVRQQKAKGRRQALFVGALKTKAREGHGIDDETFVAMLRRIEIPTHVWKSNVLEVRK